MKTIEKITAAVIEAWHPGAMARSLMENGSVIVPPQTYNEARAAAVAALMALSDLGSEELEAAVPDEDKSGAPYVVDRYIFNEHYRAMLSAMIANG